LIIVKDRVHVAEEQNVAVPELWQPTWGDLNFRRHVLRVARSMAHGHGFSTTARPHAVARQRRSID
ncbi:MAG TPA: hypothetical protein VF353_10095, partial [Candidatus Binatia bacterium]